MIPVLSTSNFRFFPVDNPSEILFDDDDESITFSTIDNINTEGEPALKKQKLA